ncbi:MAG: DMT family transporter [Veillonella sp.]|nr:DMT family transporter [Veillonella sp.]
MWQYRLILIITAFFWGSTFIFQRTVADVMSPTGYNALRFSLGALTLLPILALVKDSRPTERAHFPIWLAGLIAALFLFTGSTLQQIAIQYETAGKTAFITGLYIVLVPLAGLFIGHRLSLLALAGVVISTVGAGLLTLHSGFFISWADLLLLVSTLFWVGHILVLNVFAKQYPALKLAFLQFLAVALFSGLYACILEPITWGQAQDGWVAILWGGILSVGLGFTGQLVGQRKVPPTEASLLMSLEMVFGALLGYFLLGESLNQTELIGVILMSIGIVLAQLPCPYSIPAIWTPKSSRH